ncbi:ester cyclase [Chlorogloeopsis sp. ULAP01]|uniref:ester cyclase n=1 Tax=Chlorogloeopsis sp. ULAP01 TaxID=3056483 RepID=UPI0025AB2294|nr:ester cyclase [Chlorogloeopsis sp. ULAP01]MDM9382334.1 ester cyclase [Chlorogloeopsis sp. ULAP01]
MSVEDYKTIVRDRFYRDAVDGGNLDLVDELFFPNCTFYAAGSSEPVNRDVFKQYLGMFRTAFGFQHTIDDQIVEGEKVVARWTVHGTHQQEFRGITPTGKPLTYSGISIFRFANSKIQEVWTSMDELGLLKQLDAIATKTQVS